MEGLPTEHTTHEAINHSHEFNQELGTTAIGDVQSGLSRWASTVIQQTDTANAWLHPTTLRTNHPEKSNDPINGEENVSINNEKEFDHDQRV
jgi:hypothetical protein